jgi:UDP-N-acetylglucosamine 2-epimerase (non-hydrolysing)
VIFTRTAVARLINTFPVFRKRKIVKTPLITLVAGARPNFMKIAPIARALDRARDRFRYEIVHTGQHYDEQMNAVFLRELGIPEPALFLNAGSGSHAEQTAKIMVGFEVYAGAACPGLVMVVGDVNSTLACSIAAKKLNLAVAHVEAGLRSRDRTMPEEINRIVTDSISDAFFVTEPEGIANLLAEGHAKERIHHVGHVMIDNLLYQKDKLEKQGAAAYATAGLKAKLGRYGVVTLHRPSNVDDRETLARIMGALAHIADELPLIFPLHPRTQKQLDAFGISTGPHIHTTPPLSYMEFLNLWKDAVLVLTDSGGMQEETTALGVPCLTLRDNTERPITIAEGTNRLVGTDPTRIYAEARWILDGGSRNGRRPTLWDGHAAERVVAALPGILA